MSGRKSSEVASVLKSFENSQDKVIEKYSNDIENLITECEKVCEELEKVCEELDEDKTEINKIKSEKEQYSKEIEKNRKQSNDIRNNVRNKSDYCDEEYRQATILKNSNTELERKFNDLTIQGRNELTKLNAKYNKELEEFWKTEIQNISNKLNDRSFFYNIKEYCIDGNENSQLNLEEFLKIYTSKNLNDIKEVLSMPVPETSDEAVKIIANITKDISEYECLALKKLQKYETEISLCQTVLQAMEELGFEVNVEPIFNGEVIENFKLSCNNGDNIDFTEIKLDEDGTTIIEIDHKNGKNYNNCGVKWNEIKNKFNELGIPMTTVRKNGIDLIHGKQTKISANVQNKSKGR